MLKDLVLSFWKNHFLTFVKTFVWEKINLNIFEGGREGEN